MYLSSKWTVSIIIWTTPTITQGLFLTLEFTKGSLTVFPTLQKTCRGRKVCQIWTHPSSLVFLSSKTREILAVWKRTLISPPHLRSSGVRAQSCASALSPNRTVSFFKAGFFHCRNSQTTQLCSFNTPNRLCQWACEDSDSPKWNADINVISNPYLSIHCPTMCYKMTKIFARTWML